MTDAPAPQPVVQPVLVSAVPQRPLRSPMGQAGAAMIAGSITVILTYVLNTFVLHGGGLPEQVDQSIQTLIMAGVVGLRA